MPLQRTQKEIRQRAPLWLVGLLALNFALMTVSARDPATNERKLRGWAQAVAYPFQSLFSGAGDAGVGVFEYLGSLRTAAAENGELKRRLAESEAKVREAGVAREE